MPRAEQRAALVRSLEEEKPTGSSNNPVTIVFDGHIPKTGRIPSSFIQVVFSGDKDADTVIKERIDETAHPRSAVVVTNDRSIRTYVRRKSAKVLSCEEFLLLGRKRMGATRSEKLDPQHIRQINDEFKDIWKDK